MKKILSIGGVLILSFLSIATNAKSFSPPVNHFKISVADNLSDQLSVDQDFKDFTTSVYLFTNRIKQGKSFSLFQKFISGSINSSETESLLLSLNYPSERELVNYLVRIIELKEKVAQKFPAISVDKSSVELAAKTVIENSQRSLHTDTDCWVLWVSALSACTQGCALYSNNWELCIAECYAIVSASISWCFLTAD